MYMHLENTTTDLNSRGKYMQICTEFKTAYY